MTVLEDDEMPLRSQEDVVLVRQAVRKQTVDAGFSLVDQTKMVTAASELARNAVVHGGGGIARLQRVSEQGRIGIRLVFEDSGPGIADVSLAMKDGFSTGNGLGLGLSGAKRLSNEFEIYSRRGEGTRVTIIRWKPS
jgi:serine/threonine-protein kinase RsbT